MDDLLLLEMKMGEVVQFIPKPNPNRETNAPKINLAEQAQDILTQIEGTHANAIWNDKEPA
jgi:hypothetical protein